MSFSLDRGQTLGVVGESGSGKSVTFLTLMGLVDPAHAQVDRLRPLRRPGDPRGERLAAAEHPRAEDRDDLPGPDDLAEPCQADRLAARRGGEAPQRRVRATRRGAAPSRRWRRSRSRAPISRIDDYPHQFSGGMRQRVMIAMALINKPEVIIADEPTTALDVTMQAQILRLMEQLQHDRGTAIVMITHDLGVVAELADEVLVMYGGRVVEQAQVDDLFAQPEIPTRGDCSARCRARKSSRTGWSRFRAASVAPESPAGCAFNARCPYARPLPDRAAASCVPRPRGPGTVRCHLGEEDRRVSGREEGRLADTKGAPLERAARRSGAAEVLPGDARPDPPEEVAQVTAVDGVNFTLEARRDARRRRRVGMRQVDDGALRSLGCSSRRAQDRLRRHATSRTRPRRDAAGSSRHADGLSGSVRSLNPRMTGRRDLAEPLEVHGIGTEARAERASRELLEIVGLRPGALQPLSRTSSRAGSASASALRGRSRSSRS